MTDCGTSCEGNYNGTPVAGIDFGTSNSSVGYTSDSGVRLIDFAGDGPSVPTAVFYSDEEPQKFFGKKAVAEYRSGAEGRLLRSLKSVLGSSLIHEKTTIRNQRMAFADIISDFFGYLKSSLDAEQFNTERVVIGRPVQFVDDDAKKDRDAENQLRGVAEASGFKHVEFQFEPIAAAMAFEQTVTSEQLAFVVDIGGGTADFTLIRLSPDRRQRSDRRADILSTVGIHIGGTDLDRLFSLHSAMPHLGLGSSVKNSTRLIPSSVYFDLATWHKIPLLYNQSSLNLIKQLTVEAAEPKKLAWLQKIIMCRQGHELAASVEQAKIDLSDKLSTDFQIPSNANAECIKVSRDSLEIAIDSAIEQLLVCVRQGVQDAKVAADQVTEIFYTGGTSAIPQLRSRIQQEFPNARMVVGDAFGSVGLGLTIDANRRFCS